MFAEHQIVQIPGSADGGTWAYRLSWKLPLGSVSLNSTAAFSFAMRSEKPASFSWLCSNCSVSSRRLLPAVDLMVISAFLPPLAQNPSAPLAQPAPVINDCTLVRSLV